MACEIFKLILILKIIINIIKIINKIMENKVNKWKLNGIKVISENDLDDNTPQTKGMKRYAAIAKKKYWS